MVKKVISLILFDGTAEGPQKYSINGETTIGYKLPRESIKKDLIDVFYRELHMPGIYVLVGDRTTGKGEDIYIGQSDNVAKRLYEHKGGQDGEKESGKIFWQECIAFVTIENKIDIEYLEEQFYLLADLSNRYTLKNTNKPGTRDISEEEIINSDDFLKDCDMLSKVMGKPIFSAEKEKGNETKIVSECLTIDNSDRCGDLDPKLVVAKGYLDENGNFLVLANSLITNETTKKASNPIKKLRKELKRIGVIKEINGKLVFTKEYRFESAGIAASIVLGRSASAKEWK